MNFKEALRDLAQNKSIMLASQVRLSQTWFVLLVFLLAGLKKELA